MRLARTVLLAASLAMASFPAMAHGGGHGGWGWGWGGGWAFPGAYAAYYAPPVYPAPVAPAPAVYYAPRPVHRTYHHVAVRHRCSCYCCN